LQKFSDGPSDRSSIGDRSGSVPGRESGGEKERIIKPPVFKAKNRVSEGQEWRQ
jgi:hypothetical protein